MRNLMLGKRLLVGIAAVATAALAGCAGVWSGPEAGTSPDPTASVYEIVPGAMFNRETGKTTFTTLPIIDTVTITLPEDASVTRTYSRMSNPMTAQLLDALAMVLAATPAPQPGEEPTCGAMGGPSPESTLPKFTVTVLNHGEALAPEVPPADCLAGEQLVQDALERILKLDGYQQSIIN